LDRLTLPTTRTVFLSSALFGREFDGLDAAASAGSGIVAFAVTSGEPDEQTVTSTIGARLCSTGRNSGIRHSGFSGSSKGRGIKCGHVPGAPPDPVRQFDT
jgi:hypothetical protein